MDGLRWSLLIGLGVLVLVAVWLTWRNGSLESSLEQVGTAVIDGLWRAGVITERDRESGCLIVRRAQSGTAEMMVDGVPRAAEQIRRPRAGCPARADRSDR